MRAQQLLAKDGEQDYQIAGRNEDTQPRRDADGQQSFRDLGNRPALPAANHHDGEYRHNENRHHERGKELQLRCNIQHPIVLSGLQVAS